MVLADELSYFWHRSAPFFCGMGACGVVVTFFIDKGSSADNGGKK
jgi:hypothetical protein